MGLIQLQPIDKGQIGVFHKGTAAPPHTDLIWKHVDANGDLIAWKQYNNATSTWDVMGAHLPSFTSLAGLKAYEGPAEILHLRAGYNTRLDGSGADVETFLSLRYINTALQKGGNDLTRIQSSVLPGHWRAINAAPAIIMDHDAGAAGANSLTSVLFNSLSLHDIRVRSKNQDLSFEMDSITYPGGADARLNFLSTLFGRIKIELL